MECPFSHRVHTRFWSAYNSSLHDLIATNAILFDVTTCFTFCGLDGWDTAGGAFPPPVESPHTTTLFSLVNTANAANAASVENTVFIFVNDAISGGTVPPEFEFPQATTLFSLVNAANAFEVENIVFHNAGRRRP